MAVLLVLGLLAVTLAVSYAALRTQGTTANTARNASRTLDARLAAESGLAAAMHKISDASWQGVDIALHGDVTDDSWYEVSFTTGDTKLLPGSPSYAELPYRLTITSTGYAEDPANPDLRAIHRVRSVVQLARRQMPSDPGNWSLLTAATIYQWANRSTVVQGPVRVSGPSSINGKLFLFSTYPSYVLARDQYLTHLNAMRLAGRGDHRPFNGPLGIAYTRQDVATLNHVQVKLALATTDSSLVATTAPLTHPGIIAGYRLYPGGKVYEPPVLQTTYGASLANLTLGPDPADNPLGLFRSSGPLAINNNVRITGTIVTDSSSPEIQIHGTNVLLEAASLPRLEGSSQTLQLPVALVKTHLRINSNSSSQIKGTTIVWDDFEIKTGTPTTQFTLNGNLFTAGLNLRGRDGWTMTVSDWTSDYNDFNGIGLLNAILLAARLNAVRTSQGLPGGATVHFPEYMQYVRGFNFQPTLTLQPNSSGVIPHWQDWTQPIFIKDPGDPGLRWNLVRYEDGI
jgi:hypothetical protein